MGAIIDTPKCYLCADEGGWHDEQAAQSVICPLCRHEESLEQSRCLILPKWSNYFDRLLARWYGPRFQVAPWLLVIHSGEKKAGVAEYLCDPRDEDGKERKVSTHLAWSAKQNKLVQCVPFDRVAWHVGGACLDGNDKLNYCSIGLEMPGPFDKARADAEMDNCVHAVTWLLHAIPSLKKVVGHSEIDERKQDPGPGFDWRKINPLFG